MSCSFKDDLCRMLEMSMLRCFRSARKNWANNSVHGSPMYAGHAYDIVIISASRLTSERTHMVSSSVKTVSTSPKTKSQRVGVVQQRTNRLEEVGNCWVATGGLNKGRYHTCHTTTAGGLRACRRLVRLFVGSSIQDNLAGHTRLHRSWRLTYS